MNKGSNMNLVPRMAGRPTAGPESKSAAVGAAKVLRVAGGLWPPGQKPREMFLNPERRMGRS